MQGYGMTELSPLATVLRPEDHDHPELLRSAGRAAPCTGAGTGGFAPGGVCAAAGGITTDNRVNSAMPAIKEGFSMDRRRLSLNPSAGIPVLRKCRTLRVFC